MKIKIEHEKLINKARTLRIEDKAIVLLDKSNNPQYKVRISEKNCFLQIKRLHNKKSAYYEKYIGFISLFIATFLW
jgi:hypothetical protein